MVIITFYKTQISDVKNQIVATLVAVTCCLAQGLGVAWTSPSLPLLLSDASPFASGPVSVQTAAWIGSIISLGAFFGTIFFGIWSNSIGSKRGLVYTMLPLIMHWVILYYATAAWQVIVARSLLGFSGGGAFICFPMFVAEISSDHIRGFLSSSMHFSLYVGIAGGYAIIGHLDYYTTPLVMGALPLIFMSVFLLIPNTPQFLLKQNRTEEAEKSLRFYRNIGKGSPLKDERKLAAEMQRFVLINKQNAEQSKVQLADFSSRVAIRGLLIGPVLMAVAQFSGTFTLNNYAQTIFRETGTDIDPNVASVIMGGSQVLGCICASGFIDKLGRKCLLLISTAGTATAMAITGTFAYLSAHGFDTSAWNAVPVVSLSFFIFISAVGVTPVPFVQLAEVLPPKIRRIGSTIGVCSVSLFSFTMLQCFPMLLAYVELYGCMWMFSCVSATGFVFTLFVVTETKGMNLDQVLSRRSMSTNEVEKGADKM